eukprot:Nk52_evm105s151 gene=Nk52_evmTU105s151
MSITPEAEIGSEPMPGAAATPGGEGHGGPAGLEKDKINKEEKGKETRREQKHVEGEGGGLAEEEKKTVEGEEEGKVEEEEEHQHSQTAKAVKALLPAAGDVHSESLSAVMISLRNIGLKHPQLTLKLLLEFVSSSEMSLSHRINLIRAAKEIVSCRSEKTSKALISDLLRYAAVQIKAIGNSEGLNDEWGEALCVFIIAIGRDQYAEYALTTVVNNIFPQEPNKYLLYCLGQCAMKFSLNKQMLRSLYRAMDMFLPGLHMVFNVETRLVLIRVLGDIAEGVHRYNTDMIDKRGPSAKPAFENAEDFFTSFEILHTWFGAREAKIKPDIIRSLGALTFVIPPEKFERNMSKLLNQFSGFIKKKSDSYEATRGLCLLVKRILTGFGSNSSMKSCVDSALQNLFFLMNVTWRDFTKAMKGSQVNEGTKTEDDNMLLLTKRKGEILQSFEDICVDFGRTVLLFLSSRVSKSNSEAEVALVILERLIMSPKQPYAEMKIELFSAIKPAFNSTSIQIKLKLIEIIVSLAAHHFLDDKNAQQVFGFLLKHGVLVQPSPAHTLTERRRYRGMKLQGDSTDAETLPECSDDIMKVSEKCQEALRLITGTMQYYHQLVLDTLLMLITKDIYCESIYLAGHCIAYILKLEEQKHLGVIGGDASSASEGSGKNERLVRNAIQERLKEYINVDFSIVLFVRALVNCSVLNCKVDPRDSSDEVNEPPMAGREDMRIMWFLLLISDLIREDLHEQWSTRVKYILDCRKEWKSHDRLENATQVRYCSDFGMNHKAQNVDIELVSWRELVALFFRDTCAFLYMNDQAMYKKLVRATFECVKVFKSQRMRSTSFEFFGIAFGLTSSSDSDSTKTEHLFKCCNSRSQEERMGLSLACKHMARLHYMSLFKARVMAVCNSVTTVKNETKKGLFGRLLHHDKPVVEKSEDRICLAVMVCANTLAGGLEGIATEEVDVLLNEMTHICSINSHESDVKVLENIVWSIDIVAKALKMDGSSCLENAPVYKFEAKHTFLEIAVRTLTKLLGMKSSIGGKISKQKSYEDKFPVSQVETRRSFLYEEIKDVISQTLICILSLLNACGCTPQDTTVVHLVQICMALMLAESSMNSARLPSGLLACEQKSPGSFSGDSNINLKLMESIFERIGELDIGGTYKIDILKTISSYFLTEDDVARASAIELANYFALGTMNSVIKKPVNVLHSTENSEEAPLEDNTHSKLESRGKETVNKDGCYFGTFMGLLAVRCSDKTPAVGRSAAKALVNYIRVQDYMRIRKETLSADEESEDIKLYEIAVEDLPESQIELVEYISRVLVDNMHSRYIASLAFSLLDHVSDSMQAGVNKPIHHTLVEGHGGPSDVHGWFSGSNALLLLVDRRSRELNGVASALVNAIFKKMDNLYPQQNAVLSPPTDRESRKKAKKLERVTDCCARTIVSLSKSYLNGVLDLLVYQFQTKGHFCHKQFILQCTQGIFEVDGQELKTVSHLGSLVLMYAGVLGTLDKCIVHNVELKKDVIGSVLSMNAAEILCDLVVHEDKCLQEYSEAAFAIFASSILISCHRSPDTSLQSIKCLKKLLVGLKEFYVVEVLDNINGWKQLENPVLCVEVMSKVLQLLSQSRPSASLKCLGYLESFYNSDSEFEFAGIEPPTRIGAEIMVEDAVFSVKKSLVSQLRCICYSELINNDDVIVESDGFRLKAANCLLSLTEKTIRESHSSDNVEFHFKLLKVAFLCLNRFKPYVAEASAKSNRKE